MSKVIDLTGHKYNRLTVIEWAYQKNRIPYWKCRCDCGIIKIINGWGMRKGDIKSCGCYLRERRLECNVIHGYAKGSNKTPEYRTWVNMKKRCLDPTNKDYNSYGGVGIKICKRWLKYKNFIKDMGDKPSLKHSIDRINGKKDYKPSNCRWATPKEQTRNMKTNVWLTYMGVTMIQADWAKYLNVNSNRIWYGLNQGLTFDKIFKKRMKEIYA